jgi:hypothetical protein
VALALGRKVPCGSTLRSEVLSGSYFEKRSFSGACSWETNSQQIIL